MTTEGSRGVISLPWTAFFFFRQSIMWTVFQRAIFNHHLYKTQAFDVSVSLHTSVPLFSGTPACTLTRWQVWEQVIAVVGLESWAREVWFTIWEVDNKVQWLKCSKPTFWQLVNICKLLGLKYREGGSGLKHGCPDHKDASWLTWFPYTDLCRRWRLLEFHLPKIWFQESTLVFFLFVFLIIIIFSILILEK